MKTKTDTARIKISLEQLVEMDPYILMIHHLWILIKHWCHVARS